MVLRVDQDWVLLSGLRFLLHPDEISEGGKLRNAVYASKWYNFE